MERLSLKIESFLRTGEGDFETIALELFAYQYEKNRPYHAYCRNQGATPGTVQRWQDIPAVPVRAFKSAELATFPVARSSAIFESSQTTAGGPSRHYLKDLLFYETALKTSFSHWVLPDAAHLPFLILTPAPGEAPRSSLTWMLDVVKRKYGADGSQFVVQRGRLDEPRLASLLKKYHAAGSPVALLGTTIAFLSFFDYLKKTNQRFILATGSRMVDTGGMKSPKPRSLACRFFEASVGCLGSPGISMHQ